MWEYPHGSKRLSTQHISSLSLHNIPLLALSQATACPRVSDEPVAYSGVKPREAVTCFSKTALLRSIHQLTAIHWTMSATLLANQQQCRRNSRSTV